MAKKNKKSKNPSDILSGKKNKLDWETFNFLENLLIFCVMKEKNAPPESGVKFRITPKENDNSLCLLFNTDRRKDSLFRNDEIKPDYMVLYVKKDLCLCTIIEMKGTTEKGVKHGIEQVKELRERLKNEIQANLPNKFKVKFQAIILSPPNTQTPNNLIKEEDRKGFTILPLQYNNKAELFSYVSKINKITERYIPENIRPANSNLFVENVLTNLALPQRINDKFSFSNKEKATNKDRIYINYALSNNDDYAALAIDNAGMKIGVKESNNKFTNRIQSDLKRLGLKSTHHFEIEAIK